MSEVLQLGEELAPRDVAASALLAAAAASSRLPHSAPAPRATRDALARSLARCKVGTPDYLYEFIKKMSIGIDGYQCKANK